MDWRLLFGALCIGAGVVLGFARLRGGIKAWRQRRAVQQTPPPASPTAAPREGPRVPLEEQIERVAAAGCPLAPGIGIEDLLISFTRDEYETDPYNLLLIAYGWEVEAEPSGRRISMLATDVDMECIEGDGSYVRLATLLMDTTGRPGLMTHASDAIDFKLGMARFDYSIGAITRSLSPRLENDWADPAVLEQLMKDIETAIGDGRRFWGVENGQASTWFFIQPVVAKQLERLQESVA